ncbi:hypothetical protein C0J52_08779 [Blattella germanica]|nr:hypothetical protein C0J52_08779 [Blattella germanica]
MSIRSISVDETPDIENRAILLVEQLQPVSEIIDQISETEVDVMNKSNWKQTLGDKYTRNEVQSESQKAAIQKSNEILHSQQKVGIIDSTGRALPQQSSNSTEVCIVKAQVSTTTVPDRNLLSLELTNSHSSNLGYVNNSNQTTGGVVSETASVPQDVNEGCDEKQETVPSQEPPSSDQDYGISTTESPTSDSQSEASRIAAYDSTFASPSDDVQMLTESESISNKVVSSPEPANASLTNSGDDESPCEGTSVVHTRLPPGKVVRRRKAGSKVQASSQHRASFPMARSHMSESKAALKLEQRLHSSNLVGHNGVPGSQDSSTERLGNEDEGDSNSSFGSRRDLHRLADTPPPDWVVLGESVLIRPYNSSGVVAYIGGTDFAGGTWIGVELDAPTGVRYFTCRPKCGIFVRADKLIQDRRGRAMRSGSSRQSEGGTMKRSSSRGEGLQTLHRSRSRGEGLSSVGTRSLPRSK